jgi:signal transduction histidine kinase
MRVALKIAAWMTVVLLVLQIVMGLIRLDREGRIVEQELRRDHHIFGAALVAAVERQAEQGDGLPEALALLDDIELAEREIALDLDLVQVIEPSQRVRDGVLVTEMAVNLAGVTGRLTLREPQAELQRVALEGQRQILVESSLLLAFSLLAAALGGRVVVGTRIQKLLKRSVQIGQGDLAPQVPVAGGDELAEVGKALEHLACELERARSSAIAEYDARQTAVEQLRHADRLRLVGDLAAGVAHELGSPLHVISGNANFLADAAGLSPMLRETAQDIRDQADRMSRLVRDLLELAHPKPPSESLQPLADIWGDLRSSGEGLVRGTGVHLVLSSPPELSVKVRPALLVQALANLIRNAVQAQPEGGAVRVSAVGRDARVDLIVEDDGPGIPKSMHASVFATFFTTKPPGQGMGLGLPLVQGIVEEAGGLIRIERSASSGARFVVTLPAVESS